MSQAANEPEGKMLLYGQVLAWLGGYNLSRRRVLNLIHKGQIKRYRLGGAWYLYNKAQIKRDVLQDLDLL